MLKIRSPTSAPKLSSYDGYLREGRSKLFYQDLEDILPTIECYFDENGVLLTWPSRRKREIQLRVLARVADSFTVDVDYTEAEVNDHLKARLAFEDYALVRREMIDAGLLKRTRDCRRYWR